MEKQDCDICDNSESPTYKMCDKHYNEYLDWIKKKRPIDMSKVIIKEPIMIYEHKSTPEK